MKTVKPVFQLSSVENNFEELKNIIEKLGGTIDESKTYSNKATHLIVGKMNFTEKVFGFIAAGKWILSQSYLKYSLKANRFLDETFYHVSEGFTISQLAKVSKKWKSNIDNKTCDPPFKNWYVACFIQNESKANALLRIIKAGKGNAVILNPNARSFRNINQFTIVIHDENSFTEAKELADKLKLLCYPSQSIADYIMECVYNPVPLLPLEYYNKLFSNKIKVNQNENNEAMDVDNNQSNSTEAPYKMCLMFSYTTYLTYSNINKQPMEFMSSSIESQVFDILWKLNAFEEALFLLNSVESNKLPDSQYLNLLLEFLLTNKSSIQSFGSHKSNITKIVTYVYNSIYSYVINKLLNHPPDRQELIEYYKKAFLSLDLKSRLNQQDEIPTTQLKGFVDVLYIFSIHDFLLLKNNKHMNNCSLLLSKLIDDYSKIKLIKMMSNVKRNIPIQTYEKVLEILSFCDKYFTESYYLKRASIYLKDSKNREQYELSKSINNCKNSTINNKFFVNLFNFMIENQC